VAQQPVRIFLLHRHPLWIDALGRSLGQRRGLRVVGSAGDLESAALELAMVAADIVLVHARLVPRGLVEVIRGLLAARPQIRILVLSLEREETIRACLKAGASGYLPKSASLQDLVETLQAALAGDSATSSPLANAVLAQESEPRRKSNQQLDGAVTKREREVLELLVKGRTNQEIADGLGIALATVKIHLYRIFKKLGVHSRREAVLLLVESGAFER
jgi:DNA-binding NarL/FixJ family response regulator